MIFGIVISFKQLTLFFIRNWTGAPWAGWANYRVALNFHQVFGFQLVEMMGERGTGDFEFFLNLVHDQSPGMSGEKQLHDPEAGL